LAQLQFRFSDVGPFGPEPRRLRPPASLGDPEKRVFVDVVTGCDPRHFRTADLPRMARYAEAVVLAERAAFELAQPNATVTPNGKVSPWFGVHQAACKTISALSLRLRLGPQSRQPRAHKTTTGPVSYYEKMALMVGPDDDGAQRN
jgi:hypothetical protein